MPPTTRPAPSTDLGRGIDRRNLGKVVLSGAVLAGGAALAVLAARRRARGGTGSGVPVRHTSSLARNTQLAKLGASTGAGFAAHRARRVFASDERRVELAFENHRFYDLKRWRLAHEVWDGDRSAPDAVVRALWPYRIVRPGDPRHNTYVFVERVAPRLAQPRFFRLGNYYSHISEGIRNGNPKIVPNPFH